MENYMVIKDVTPGEVGLIRRVFERLRAKTREEVKTEFQLTEADFIQLAALRDKVASAEVGAKPDVAFRPRARPRQELGRVYDFTEY
jgi:hypothetical protein